MSRSNTPAESLLTLTMIVKNEAHGIERTLASVRPYIDRWCILDTGSTDGTQGAVRAALRGVPGDLHEEPFIDFATTRNRGLDLCGRTTPFILWLDADDELRGGEALRAFLSRERDRPGAECDAHHVRVEIPDASFDSARVLHSASGWRFVGAVHEVLTHPERPPPAGRIQGLRILHAAQAESNARSRIRWERDVALLEREVSRNPSATRPAFYLGMTLLWLGRYQEAMRALARRIDLGGWAEEVFYAKLSRARAARGAELPWSEVLRLFLEAHAFAPHRAEPLFDVAMYYDAANDRALAMLFARRAYELPFPAGDTLFVEHEVYAWRAADLVGTHGYWLGELTLGEAAARKAAEARPDDPRIARNLAFYENR